MSERTESQRISDLEAWAFRAGRDLADIKNRLDRTATIAAVDALHQDVRNVSDAVFEGFDNVNGKLDTLNGEFAGVKAELAGQRQLLEEILRRLPAAQ